MKYKLSGKMDMVYSQVRTQWRANIAWDVTSLLGGVSKHHTKRIRIIGDKERQKSEDWAIVLVAPYLDYPTLRMYLTYFYCKPPFITWSFENKCIFVVSFWLCVSLRLTSHLKEKMYSSRWDFIHKVWEVFEEIQRSCQCQNLHVACLCLS